MLNRRLQTLYQKTDFNNSKICQLSNIIRCIKCRKNNNIENNVKIINCLFCGTPNYTKERK